MANTQEFSSFKEALESIVVHPVTKAELRQVKEILSQSELKRTVGEIRAVFNLPHDNETQKKVVLDICRGIASSLSTHEYNTSSKIAEHEAFDEEVPEDLYELLGAIIVLQTFIKQQLAKLAIDLSQTETQSNEQHAESRGWEERAEEQLKLAESLRQKVEADLQQIDQQTQQLLSQISPLVTTNAVAIAPQLNLHSNTLQTLETNWNTLQSQKTNLSQASGQIGRIRDRAENDLMIHTKTSSQQALVSIETTLSQFDQIQQKLTETSDVLWVKRALIDVPEIATAFSDMAPTSIPNIPALAPDQKIIQSFAYLDAFSQHVEAARPMIQAQNERRQALLASELVTQVPARSGSQNMNMDQWLKEWEEQTVETWEANFEQVYPEFISPGAPGTFRELYGQMNAALAAGFSGLSHTDLRQKSVELRHRREIAFDSILTPTAPLVTPNELIRERILESRQLLTWIEIVDSLVQTMESVVVERETALNSSNEAQLLVDETRTKISLIESLSPVSLQVDQDRIELRLSELYQLLRRCKDKLTEAEYQAIELEVALCDWRETKRAIIERITDDEMDLKNSAFYFVSGSTSQTSGWDIVIAKERGYGRLENLISTLRRNPTGALLVQQAEADLKRFKKELGFRRTVFFAEQDLEPMIVGVGKKDADASRDIPSQAPEIFISMDDFPTILNPSESLADDVRLRAQNEVAFNRELPSRRDTIRNFSEPDSFVELDSFTPTAHGEVMRMLDLLYSNKLHLRVREVLANQGRTPTAEEDELINSLDGYYKSLHITNYKNNLHTVISKVSEMICTSPITPEEVRHAWLFHVLLLNQSMMIPGSSPRTNDNIYKANQWAQYVADGTMQGTTAASIFEAMCLFRIYDDRVPATNGNIRGKRYLLDRLGKFDVDNLPKPQGLTEKLGYWSTNLPRYDRGKTARHKVRETLSERGLDDFAFIAELPLVLIHETDQGTYPVIPLPMQYMIFKDPDMALAPGVTLKPGETPVLRWPITSFVDGQGNVVWNNPPPVTAADFTNERGEIMYELIPWHLVLKGNAIEQWYNNGKNIKKLYEMFTTAPSDVSLGVDNLPKEQNDVKYAASFFPGWGLEVACGRYNAQAVFNRVTRVHVFARAISLLAFDKLELKQVQDKLSYLISRLGDGGEDAVEAIGAALDATYGTMENAQQTNQLIVDQFKFLFAFQK